jgi:hypothetical protein
MLTAALDRYSQQNDIRKIMEGRFTPDQVMFLMRMGGSEVAGSTPNIRTRNKEVMLGAFTRKGRYRDGHMVFRVRAGTRSYLRHSDFLSWEALVEALPSVQETFDLRFPYMEPLPERVHLLYSVIADRLGSKRGGWGSRRWLYYAHASEGGVRFKYTADRWREHYEEHHSVTQEDAEIVRTAYSYVASPDVVRQRG